MFFGQQTPLPPSLPLPPSPSPLPYNLASKSVVQLPHASVHSPLTSKSVVQLPHVRVPPLASKSVVQLPHVRFIPWFVSRCDTCRCSKKTGLIILPNIAEYCPTTEITKLQNYQNYQIECDMCLKTSHTSTFIYSALKTSRHLFLFAQP